VAARIDDERRMAEVRRAMAEIPVQERNTIELVLWSGLSLAKAAQVLQVAEGTVKSPLARGRSHLARLFSEASTDSEDLS
jgi:RNA polymerase sigma-70 factor (ECF subfamily)